MNRAQRRCASLVFTLSFLVAQTAAPRDLAPASPAAASDDSAVSALLQKLNAIPEQELSETQAPALPLLKTLYDTDGPDYQHLRDIAESVAADDGLNPGVKCVVGHILGDRWDTFRICGTLFLEGLRSSNPALRKIAREKFVVFLQPSLVPGLIAMLDVPTARADAHAILKEISGKTYEPKSHIWKAWWGKFGSKLDFVGHLINDTHRHLATYRTFAFRQSRYWYAPNALKKVPAPEAHLSAKDQEAVNEWRAWVQSDVKKYVNTWSSAKPYLDRIVHQPDPRVSRYLEKLLPDNFYGDYASMALAWRSSHSSLPLIEQYYKRTPTPGRALARGSLGDKVALRDLLAMVIAHPQPLTQALMDDQDRAYMLKLHAVGVLPAEQAFELLAHRAFHFEDALTAGQKKKSAQQAKHWLDKNERLLVLDNRRGYYVIPNEAP